MRGECQCQYQYLCHHLCLCLCLCLYLYLYLHLSSFSLLPLPSFLPLSPNSHSLSNLRYYNILSCIILLSNTPKESQPHTSTRHLKHSDSSQLPWLIGYRYSAESFQISSFTIRCHYPGGHPSFFPSLSHPPSPPPLLFNQSQDSLPYVP